jgi:glutamate 5-kinase
MKRRPRALAAQQAAASVGQGLLVRYYTKELARHEITAGQVLLTVDDVTRRSHYRNAFATFGKLIELGVLPIVNENDTVATSEIRFGDNDRLAALVAHLVHADLLVLLSDVDGLYDAPPTTPGASRIGEVTALDQLAGVQVGKVDGAGLGTGGMVTKLEAARIAVEAGIPVVLTAADHAAAALAGDDTGTLFHATGRRRGTRMLWLAHATEPAGAVTLDAGAVRALTQRGASLLAAGVTGASGGFHAGDPVDLVGPDGAVVARGLVAYDAEEIPLLVGRSSKDLEADLGPAYAREVVHRDDLVLL